MKKLAGWLTLSFSFVFGFAQAQVDEETDSTKIVSLDNVVITGQYSSQSIDKSIYQVEVISQEDIKNFAGNTVADVLNQNLNMLILPSRSTGDSEIQIMGLGGEYTKILIDNIPVVGDHGMGVNIDLTKLNLDNIERIEIVKGAMGVDYGNNALTGVINIITKKSILTKWKINALIQEETVNKEYDWYEGSGLSKGKGRHIQGLEVSHNISDNWFASLGVNRNDFQGYWGEKDGSKVLENRGYEWLPKETWNANGMINYRGKDLRIFYKANYLHEDINYYNPSINPIPLGGGNQTYVANDRNYETERWIHHLNVDAKLFNRIKFIGDFSYQSQDRKLQFYVYDVPSRSIFSEGDYKTYASSESFYSRGTFSNFLNKENVDFQVGYELDNTNGIRSRESGEALFSEDLDKTLGTYAAFASAEIRTNSGLSLRPGVRANFSSKFDEQFNFSLSSRYDLTDRQSIRAVIGTTNRYPGFDELYTYFVDSNHDVRGNENLEPEKGYSTSIQWNNTYKNNGFRMQNNISTIYLNLDDKIELATVNFIPLQYQYINIDKYQSWGINTDHQFSYNNLNVNLGASYYGISRGLESNTDVEVKDNFRYTFELNASANYRFEKINTTISAYYKYTGKLTEYVLADALGDAYYRLGEQDPYSLMDASIRKGFFNNNLELTLGVRNIFDVTSVNNSIEAGDTHTGAPNQLMLFYGRSYFLKLNYTLNFN